jgi:alpha-tubulin suppressor-like RCC1 family protein
LGDGTTTPHNAPEQIQSTKLLTNIVTMMSGGYYHSLYVREDGSLWATGYNADGELGDGTTSNHHSYEEILSSNVTAIAAGGYHSLFLESGGGLWAMGYNGYGQLGDNSMLDQQTPEQVAVNVTAIAAGYYHSLFIKSDGSLWAMGNNADGELGDGTYTNQPLPVLIVSSNVVAVAAGEYDSFFIKSDGSLWAMGANGYGQLGDGTYTNRPTPVQVVPLVIPQPAITNISLATTNLVLSGTNGQSGRTYFTLMSPNLALPLNQWTPVATNVSTTDGTFAIIATNAVVPNAAQRFYVLQVQ